jgi:hypothetical protein
VVFLLEVSVSSYKDKLNDPRWKARRLEIIEKAGGACEDCGKKTHHLNVHHGFYEPGHNPWEYEDDVLMALCKRCHENRHEVMKGVLWNMAQIRNGNAIDGLYQAFLLLASGSYRRLYCQTVEEKENNRRDNGKGV